MKQLEGSFNSAGADMCLEQTINRFQKSTCGIIGCTKRKQVIVQWDILYHVISAIVNLPHEISGVTTPSTNLVNHEFNVVATLTYEILIHDMINTLKIMKTQ